MPLSPTAVLTAEHHVPVPDTAFRRYVFASRLRHELTSETHVIVGDHPPERRVDHDAPTVKLITMIDYGPGLFGGLS